jgi:hypothetical protein
MGQRRGYAGFHREETRRIDQRYVVARHGQGDGAPRAAGRAEPLNLCPPPCPPAPLPPCAGSSGYTLTFRSALRFFPDWSPHFKGKALNIW